MVKTYDFKYVHDFHTPTVEASSSFVFLSDGKLTEVSKGSMNYIVVEISV